MDRINRIIRDIKRARTFSYANNSANKDGYAYEKLNYYEIEALAKKGYAIIPQLGGKYLIAEKGDYNYEL